MLCFNKVMTMFEAFLFLLGLAPLLYPLPGVIAVLRRVPCAGEWLFMNLLYGWTVVGWFWVLTVALEPRERGDIG